MKDASGIDDGTVLRASGLAKTFVLHTQGGVEIPVFAGLDFSVRAGECVVLSGRSGCGKSTLMRSLYANYRVDAGRIEIRHEDRIVDLATAPAHEILAVRRRTLGHVSQFLRVIPRVATIDIVAQPLRAAGIDAAAAERRAAELLARLNLPSRLWKLAPATFSGGEQQRVNIAHGFALARPVLLLDEPTASLDEGNRNVVIELIEEAKRDGAAIVAICHDHEVRNAIADRLFEMPGGRLAA
ncbi:Alpha-D-ribose 1-methylphosphonate 5-triphosphate synthase subunit PhnL [Oceanibacterium hippocampi]|uniref:Alpha-D-ribose 1-methylphosphonate 5-triphosphate synthase subunit PhnL n=2 Tax=Oceanibacterium hippocampi TaxID=745714 RepID=A0A1Y5U0N0_9PROT|nr:Alpha-D-ribose 1-methylphosphonate 5-triphosphate synthase subunit PhnL [Oceanibacterium hippocampi]